MEERREFWDLVNFLKAQKISEKTWGKIQKVIDEVVGVISCTKNPSAVDYQNALKALREILEEEKIKL